MNTKEKIAVMQAWLDGKTIQFHTHANHSWTDISRDREPRWDWSECSYRIKPKEPMPATPDEIEEIESVIFVKQGNGGIDVTWEHFFSSKLSRKDVVKYNPDTKCWEDWSEEGEQK